MGWLGELSYCCNLTVPWSRHPPGLQTTFIPSIIEGQLIRNSMRVTVTYVSFLNLTVSAKHVQVTGVSGSTVSANVCDSWSPQYSSHHFLTDAANVLINWLLQGWLNRLILRLVGDTENESESTEYFCLSRYDSLQSGMCQHRRLNC